MNEEMMASMVSWLPILFMIFIFYFMLYRPQKRARQERDEMLSSLKVGTRIVTIGGIFGTITWLGEENLKIQIADNVEIKITRGAIGSLVQKNDDE